MALSNTTSNPIQPKVYTFIFRANDCGECCEQARVREIERERIRVVFSVNPFNSLNTLTVVCSHAPFSPQMMLLVACLMQNHLYLLCVLIERWSHHIPEPFHAMHCHLLCVSVYGIKRLHVCTSKFHWNLQFETKLPLWNTGTVIWILLQILWYSGWCFFLLTTVS